MRRQFLRGPWQIQTIVKARQIPESRGGPSVRTSQSGGFPEPPLRSSVSSLPSSHPTSHSPFTLPLKIKNSGVLTAPLQLLNSGSVAITTGAATTSNKVNLKNLEHLCCDCKGDRQALRSLKHAGNKRPIFKNAVPSSASVRSCWAYTDSVMHTMHISRHLLRGKPHTSADKTELKEHKHTGCRLKNPSKAQFLLSKRTPGRNIKEPLLLISDLFQCPRREKSKYLL